MKAPLVSFIDHRVIGLYFPWIMKGLVPTSSPLQGKMRMVKEIGYSGLGVSWWDLVSFYQERGDLNQLKVLSNALELPITGYTFMVDGWAFCPDRARENVLSLARTSIDLAREAGCQTACLVGPFDSGDIRQAAKTFRELAQYADQFGMRLGLEFLGFAQQVNGIRSAIEVVDLADVPNGGIAVDSYHFFAGASSLKDLEDLPLSKIYAVHLADISGDLHDPSVDVDRRMPGEGKLPLGEFIQTMAKKGFDGFWHVECIRGQDYAAELRSVAMHAFNQTTRFIRNSLSLPTAVS